MEQHSTQSILYIYSGEQKPICINKDEVQRQKNKKCLITFFRT